MDATLIPSTRRFPPLAHALVEGCLALARQLGQPVPAVNDPAALTGADGLELMHEALGHLWPASTTRRPHEPRARGPTARPRGPTARRDLRTEPRIPALLQRGTSDSLLSAAPASATRGGCCVTGPQTGASICCVTGPQTGASIGRGTTE